MPAGHGPQDDRADPQRQHARQEREAREVAGQAGDGVAEDEGAARPDAARVSARPATAAPDSGRCLHRAVQAREEPDGRPDADCRNGRDPRLGATRVSLGGPSCRLAMPTAANSSRCRPASCRARERRAGTPRKADGIDPIRNGSSARPEM